MIRVGPIGFKAPYVVALVELADGPYVLGNLEGLDPNQVTLETIGRRVSVGYRLYPPPDPECGIEGLALTFTLLD